MVDVAHDGDDRRARQRLRRRLAPTSSSVKASGSSSAAVTALWPISSTTIMAVSWSSGWLMVTIWPIFISALITSDALTAILCASSATVMVSGTCTSMTRCFDRCGLLAWSSRWSRSLPRRPRGPPRQLLRPTPPDGVAAGRDFLLLGRIVRPAGGQLGRLDFLAGARARPGAAARGRARPVAPAGLCSVPLTPGLAGSGALATGFSGGLGDQHLLGRASSSSGWRRPRPRPCGGARRGRAARAASSSARALDSAAAFSRASAAACRGVALRLGRGLGRFGLGRLGALAPAWRPCFGVVRRRRSPRRARSRRLRARGASCSSRWRRFSARSSSWRRISSAWRRASSSRRASSASSARGAPAAAACGLGRFDHGGVAAFVALDEGALLAHFHLDGAGLAGGVGLLDLAGGLLHQGDLLALGRGGAVAGLQVTQQLLLVGFATARRSARTWPRRRCVSCSSSVSGDFLSSLANSATVVLDMCSRCLPSHHCVARPRRW